MCEGCVELVDIVHAPVSATSTFRFFDAYNMVAFLYLILTTTLSLLVRRAEIPRSSRVTASPWSRSSF